MPRRLRPFAHIGDDTTEVGAWRHVTELPFWSSEEADLVDKLRSADLPRIDE